MPTTANERAPVRRNSPADEALVAAAALGTLIDVQDAIKQGANLQATNSEGAGALVLAAIANRDPAIARFLIERGCDVNDGALGGITVLHAFAKHGNLELVKLALERGARVNGLQSQSGLDEDPPSPLMFATDGNHLKVMQTLLEHGANLHQKHWSGRQAIHVATSPEAIELLCAGGARLNPVDYFARPPLFIAAARPDGAALCEALIKHGANVNLRGIEGETALHVGRAPAAQTLIKHGAEIDPVNVFDLTPLGYAACYDDAEKCRILLAYGASLAPAGAIAPLAAAARDQSFNSFAVLLEAGADPARVEQPLLDALVQKRPELLEIIDAAARRIKVASAKLALDAISTPTAKPRPA